MTLPFVLASVLCGIIVATIDELALPPLTQAIGETEELLLTEEVSHGLTAYDGRHHLWISLYDHATKTMGGVLLIQLRENLRPELILQAKSGQWDASRKQWIFRDGIMTPYGPDGSAEVRISPGESPRRAIDPIPTQGYTCAMDIRPEHFHRKFSISGQFHSMREISERLEKAPHDPRLLLMRYAKFTTPLSSIILLFLGLPFVVSARGKSFIRGLMLCMLLTVAFYAVHLGGLELGKVGRLDPFLAGWIAPLLFGSMGLVNFTRMRG